MMDMPDKIWATGVGAERGRESGVFVEVGCKWPSAPNADAVEYTRTNLMPAWQPIETAPHGEYVLLWGGGSVLFGIYGWEEDDGPVFYHDGPGYRGCTHWMPLPDPPRNG